MYPFTAPRASLHSTSRTHMRSINMAEYVLEILRCLAEIKLSIFLLKLSFLVVVCCAVKSQSVIKIKI